MYEIMPMTRKPRITRAYNPFALFDELEKSFFAQPPCFVVPKAIWGWFSSAASFVVAPVRGPLWLMME